MSEEVSTSETNKGVGESASWEERAFNQRFEEREGNNLLAGDFSRQGAQPVQRPEGRPKGWGRRRGASGEVGQPETLGQILTRGLSFT